jgi:hypothetical protein
MLEAIGQFVGIRAFVVIRAYAGYTCGSDMKKEGEV